MIAVVSTSTLVSASDVVKMVKACKYQVVQHFGPGWSRNPAWPEYFSKKSDVPAGTPTVLIGDELDDPDALAYHTEGLDGTISGLVGVKKTLEIKGATVLHGALSVAVDLSHEILETEADPFVNIWAGAADGRRLFSFEVCDPVQSDSYEIGDVSVSNFVFPRYFDAFAPADGSVRFDFLKKLTAPFQVAEGGYAVVMAEGKTSQIGMRSDRKPQVPATRSARRREHLARLVAASKAA